MSERGIVLSRWCASVACGSAGRLLPQADGSQRVGEVAVHHADPTVDVATFGHPDDVSVALVDGYLFDRRTLLVELSLRGLSSDADIVAAAYERWGVDFLHHLTGSYLAAVWDARGRRLILGHDALGRHPVFYANSGDRFWFSSNVRALTLAGYVSNAPSRRSLALHALMLWPEAGETFFESVSRLKPGHYLEVAEDGSRREYRYWHPLPSGENEWMSEREAIARFEPTLTRAIERCMQFAPDGIMLSGGIDSVVVAALAAERRREERQEPLVAVSARLDQPLMHEEQPQFLVTRALGMTHLVSRRSEWTGGIDGVTASLAVSPHLPGPSRVHWVGAYIAFWNYVASHGLHVLLTGSGGDHWLGVADMHAADLMRKMRLFQLTRFVRTAAGTGGSAYPVAIRRLVWAGGLRPLADTLATQLFPGTKRRFHARRAQAALPAWLAPDADLRRDIVDRLLARRIPGLDAHGCPPRNYYLHSLAHTTNPYMHHEFETHHHVSAMCGLRMLSPFHDKEVVEFATRVPPLALVHQNKYKGLLRPIAERHLPGLGFGQQRKVYPRAMLDQQRRELHEGVLRHWPACSFSSLAKLGIVTADVLKSQLPLSQVPSMDGLVRMFGLMSAETWLAGEPITR